MGRAGEVGVKVGGRKRLKEQRDDNLSDANKNLANPPTHPHTRYVRAKLAGEINAALLLFSLAGRLG